MNRLAPAVGLLAAVLVVGVADPAARPQPPAAVDPLPAWNDTPTKKAITAFVDKVTRDGSPDFAWLPEPVGPQLFPRAHTITAELTVPPGGAEGW